MDGLLVKNIPKVLLARILVQLYIIPQQLIKSPHFDLLAVLGAGLRDYGDSGDLNGFLSFCAQKSFDSIELATPTSDTTSWIASTWRWRDHTLSSLSDHYDYDLLDEQKNQSICDAKLDKPATNMIGLRLQIDSAKVRPHIDLVRYGRKSATLHDERFTCKYEGRYIALENILGGALEYMSNCQLSGTESTSNTTNTAAAGANSTEETPIQPITGLLKQRIEQLTMDRRIHEEKFTGQPETDFVLMGALMVKLDAIQTNGAAEDAWYLYLRDYTIDISGSNWRIIKGPVTSTTTDGQVEIRISSHQVLADLRGTKVKNDQGLECIPSPTSKNYRPVYLFYCNNDIVSRSAPDPLETKPDSSSSGDKVTAPPASEQNKDQSITLNDYSFDNDGNSGSNMDYEWQDDGDGNDDLAMEMCKICGIPESIDNINTIFFCDECNLGVHQLCEQPSIAAFEMNIDPWYCRDCCARKGLPLPTPPHYITPRSEDSTEVPLPLSSPSTAVATTTTDPILHPEEISLTQDQSSQPLSSTTSNSTITTESDSATSNKTVLDNINTCEVDTSTMKKRKLGD